MTNSYGITEREKEHLKKTIKNCVYCNVKLKEYSHTKCGDKETIEHIDNDDLNPLHKFNIVLCCNSCNSSKKAKKLCDWLELDYCKRKNINRRTITNKKVREFIKKHCPK